MLHKYLKSLEEAREVKRSIVGIFEKVAEAAGDSESLQEEFAKLNMTAKAAHAQKVCDHPVVDAILRSMQPAVAAVILFAAVDMFKPLVKKKRLSIWILFLAALGIGLYGVNIIWILIGGGIIGACLSALGGKRHAR